jgi:S-DNA-T family DNA segregation ATPase FtsK/SpoIIIE
MSLSRILNKTPIQNKSINVYELDQLDNSTVEQLSSSRFIGEGVYGIEMFSATDYSETYLITPSFDKSYDYTITHKDWHFKSESLNELAIYKLSLANQVFMPLDTKQYIDICKVIQSLKYSPVYMQILFCKRMDNWKDGVITLYEEYLKGVDHPFELKMLRDIQRRSLKFFSRIGSFQMKREPIVEIENKILQDNYRFECRFVVYEGKYCSYFEEEMMKNLKKLNLFNEFMLNKVKNKRNMISYIETRSFQGDLQNQMLSKQELFSLLCDKAPVEVKSEVKIDSHNVIKQHSTLSNNINQSISSIMPVKNAEVDEELDQQTLKQIQHAFKRVGITDKSIKIKDVINGSTLYKVKIEVPNEVTFTSINKNIKNLQSAIGNENISIEISDEPDVIDLFMPKKNRRVLYLGNVMESETYKAFCNDNKLPFILGENTSGELMMACLAKLKHILVAGATGSGKSVFMNNLIYGLLTNVPPTMLNMILIDPKKVEFSQYRGIPQAQIITDMNKAVGIVSQLCDEMDRRYDVMSEIGARNIDQYNSKSESKLPYLVCIIDEYADLMETNKEVESYVIRMGAKARAAGIHLVIATQRPSVDVITGVLKSNLPSAISFRLKSSSDYKTVFGKGCPYTLLGNGDGVAMLEGQLKEFERFQTPIMTLDENEEEEIFDKLVSCFENVQVDQMEICEVKIDEPIDKLKRIIVNLNELRITELQKEMGIGINKVTALMKQLVEDEWLRKDGRSYELNIDEEELSKWREDDIGE